MKLTQILLASVMTATTVTAFADFEAQSQEVQPQEIAPNTTIDEQSTAADTATIGPIATEENAVNPEGAVESNTTETPAQ
jgi:hypothetical protein